MQTTFQDMALFPEPTKTASFAIGAFILWRAWDSLSPFDPGAERIVNLIRTEFHGHVPYDVYAVVVAHAVGLA